MEKKSGTKDFLFQGEQGIVLGAPFCGLGFKSMQQVAEAGNFAVRKKTLGSEVSGDSAQEKYCLS